MWATEPTLGRPVLQKDTSEVERMGVLQGSGKGEEAGEESRVWAEVQGHPG